MNWIKLLGWRQFFLPFKLAKIMQTYTNNIKREMLISQESLPLRSHLVASLLKVLQMDLIILEDKHVLYAFIYNPLFHE